MSDNHRYPLRAWVSVSLATPIILVGVVAGWTWQWLAIAFDVGRYGLDNCNMKVRARLLDAQTRLARTALAEEENDNE